MARRQLSLHSLITITLTICVMFILSVTGADVAWDIALYSTNQYSHHILSTGYIVCAPTQENYEVFFPCESAHVSFDMLLQDGPFSKLSTPVKVTAQLFVPCPVADNSTCNVMYGFNTTEVLPSFGAINALLHVDILSGGQNPVRDKLFFNLIFEFRETLSSLALPEQQSSVSSLPSHADAFVHATQVGSMTTTIQLNDTITLNIRQLTSSIHSPAATLTGNATVVYLQKDANVQPFIPTLSRSLPTSDHLSATTANIANSTSQMYASAVVQYFVSGITTAYSRVLLIQRGSIVPPYEDSCVECLPVCTMNGLPATVSPFLLDFSNQAILVLSTTKDTYSQNGTNTGVDTEYVFMEYTTLTITCQQFVVTDLALPFFAQVVVMPATGYGSEQQKHIYFDNPTLTVYRNLSTSTSALLPHQNVTFYSIPSNIANQTITPTYALLPYAPSSIYAPIMPLQDQQPSLFSWLNQNSSPSMYTAQYQQQYVIMIPMLRSVSSNSLNLIVQIGIDGLNATAILLANLAVLNVTMAENHSTQRIYRQRNEFSSADCLRDTATATTTPDYWFEQPTIVQTYPFLHDRDITPGNINSSFSWFPSVNLTGLPFDSGFGTSWQYALDFSLLARHANTNPLDTLYPATISLRYTQPYPTLTFGATTGTIAAESTDPRHGGLLQEVRTVISPELQKSSSLTSTGIESAKLSSPVIVANNNDQDDQQLSIVNAITASSYLDLFPDPSDVQQGAGLMFYATYRNMSDWPSNAPFVTNLLSAPRPSSLSSSSYPHNESFASPSWSGGASSHHGIFQQIVPPSLHYVWNATLTIPPSRFSAMVWRDAILTFQVPSQTMLWVGDPHSCQLNCVPLKLAFIPTPSQPVPGDSEASDLIYLSKMSFIWPEEFANGQSSGSESLSSNSTCKPPALFPKWTPDNSTFVQFLFTCRHLELWSTPNFPILPSPNQTVPVSNIHVGVTVSIQVFEDKHNATTVRDLFNVGTLIQFDAQYHDQLLLPSFILCICLTIGIILLSASWWYAGTTFAFKQAVFRAHHHHRNPINRIKVVQ